MLEYRREDVTGEVEGVGGAISQELLGCAFFWIARFELLSYVQE